MGPQQAGQVLAAGCNDMGGSIMNESITRAAGELRLAGCARQTWSVYHFVLKSEILSGTHTAGGLDSV
jgi:2-iminoacetate synthase ThiH